MQEEDHALEGSMWALRNEMGSPWHGCQQHPRRSGSREGEPALVLHSKAEGRGRGPSRTPALESVAWTDTPSHLCLGAGA